MPILIFLKVNNIRSVTKLDLRRNPCQWQWIKGTSIKLAEMGGPVSSILFRKWFLIRSMNGELRLKKPGYTTSCQVLAFQPEAFYGEVTRNIVTLHRLQKIPDLGTIQIMQKDYHYATNKFEEVMETLGEDLVKIFLYQFIEMSFINFETSKLLNWLVTTTS